MRTDQVQLVVGDALVKPGLIGEGAADGIVVDGQKYRARGDEFVVQQARVGVNAGPTVLVASCAKAKPLLDNKIAARNDSVCMFFPGSREDVGLTSECQFAGQRRSGLGSVVLDA